MLGIELKKREGDPFHVLCLGAHSDDLEIGCGGTMLRLLTEYENIHIVWIVFCAVGERAREAKAAAGMFLNKAKNVRVELMDFRDGFFPYGGDAIKERFESLKSECSPHLILTHCRHDLHQDHRLISELTWNTFRDHLIWEYEVVKYDGDLGTPNFFVPLSSDIAEKKAEIIMTSFPSQSGKRWFTKDAFLSVMRIRGIECNAREGYAEGYFCRKAVF